MAIAAATARTATMRGMSHFLPAVTGAGTVATLPEAGLTAATPLAGVALGVEGAEIGAPACACTPELPDGAAMAGCAADAAAAEPEAGMSVEAAWMADRPESMSLFNRARSVRKSAAVWQRSRAA